MKKLPELKFHEHSCFNCRYYRIHITGCTESLCLLLGQTLTLTNDAYPDLARFCDGWKRRPKTWNICTQGVKNNPFWRDPYIPRKTQLKLRGENK
jgi:hypothetical protein